MTKIELARKLLAGEICSNCRYYGEKMFNKDSRCHSFERISEFNQKLKFLHPKVKNLITLKLLNADQRGSCKYFEEIRDDS